MMESLPAQFLFFDLAGRLVQDITGEFPQGENEVYISELLPGIYFCRMISGDFTATQRFTVVD